MEGFLEAVLVVDHAADGKARAGEAVLDRHLVLGDEQRDDVAGGLKIGGRIEEGGEFLRAGGGGSEDEGIAAFAGEDVAAVGSGAPVAGDIPAAPAFGEEGLVIDDLRAVAQERVAGGVDEERADEEPGNFAHEGPAVAAQAVLIAGAAERVPGNASE